MYVDGSSRGARKVRLSGRENLIMKKAKINQETSIIYTYRNDADANYVPTSFESRRLKTESLFQVSGMIKFIFVFK